MLEANAEAAMSEDLKRIQQRARELAHSGKFIGSLAVAFELQFEPGYARWSTLSSSRTLVSAILLAALPGRSGSREPRTAKSGWAGCCLTDSVGLTEILW